MKQYPWENSPYRRRFPWGLILFGAIVIGVIALVIGLPIYIGVGGCGPQETIECTVNRMYVDISGSGDSRQSHYMVGTDRGVFEIDNGILLGMWNADKIYASLKEGKRYKFTTKGNEVVGMFCQYYPYIIKAEPLPDLAPENPK